MDFAGCKVRLVNITVDIDTNRQRLASAIATITAVNNTLGNMPTTYAEPLSTIDANAAANAAWAQAKADKDQLVADFVALKAYAQAAVNALTP